MKPFWLGILLIAIAIPNDSWLLYIIGFFFLLVDIGSGASTAVKTPKPVKAKPEPEPELPWFQQDKPMFPVVDEEFLSWERCLVVEYMNDHLLWWHLEDELWTHLQHMRARQAQAQLRNRPAAPPVKVRRR